MRPKDCRSKPPQSFGLSARKRTAPVPISNIKHTPIINVTMPAQQHVMDTPSLVIGKRTGDAKDKGGSPKGGVRRASLEHAESHRLKVNIYGPDDTLIMSNVEIAVLRRFSKDAKGQLPIANWTTSKDAALKYTMPVTGYSQPSDEAVTWLVN